MRSPDRGEHGYTYADYRAWRDEARWELIDGEAYAMSPAPGRAHQRVVGRIFARLHEITEDGPCETIVSPFDVRLADPAERTPNVDADGSGTDAPAPDAATGSGDRRGDGSAAAAPDPAEAFTTVVQPDVAVFCDPSVLDDAGAHGAPTIAVEVLSEATSYRDLTVKMELYRRHGVVEYWVVNPEVRWVQVYRLGQNGRYAKPDHYTAGEAITVAPLGGAPIELSRIFRRRG